MSVKEWRKVAFEDPINTEAALGGAVPGVRKAMLFELLEFNKKAEDNKKLGSELRTATHLAKIMSLTDASGGQKTPVALPALPESLTEEAIKSIPQEKFASPWPTSGLSDVETKAIAVLKKMLHQLDVIGEKLRWRGLLDTYKRIAAQKSFVETDPAVVWMVQAVSSALTALLSRNIPEFPRADVMAELDNVAKGLAASHMLTKQVGQVKAAAPA